MRGSFTIRIEKRPTIVRMSDEITMIEKVHRIVFHKSFEERSLLIETIAVEKTSGITRYLPTLMNSSDKNERKFTHATLSVGSRNTAATPNKTPSKYLTQTFIIYDYNILWIAMP